ncbi:hypothetical protein D1007_13146 [Hordeum vulgare]|nr:hypothetical protein D1007_13146 [Hordeum vulgare]
MVAMPEYPDTEEPDTINFEATKKNVKEVATIIRESKTVDVYLELYGTIMEQGGFNPEALMVALSHPLDNKAQCVGFVFMAEAHKVLWLGTWLDKHYHYSYFCWWRRRA